MEIPCKNCLVFVMCKTKMRCNIFIDMEKFTECPIALTWLHKKPKNWVNEILDLFDVCGLLTQEE
jgi:hypothetical protein